MDVVLDLITNLENARFMDYRVLQPRRHVTCSLSVANLLQVGLQPNACGCDLPLQ